VCVCVLTCVYVFMCILISVFLSGTICVYVYVCVHACTCVRVCVRACMCACVCAWMCVCMWLFSLSHTHIHRVVANVLNKVVYDEWGTKYAFFRYLLTSIVLRSLALSHTHTHKHTHTHTHTQISTRKSSIQYLCFDCTVV